MFYYFFILWRFNKVNQSINQSIWLAVCYWNLLLPVYLCQSTFVSRTLIVLLLSVYLCQSTFVNLPLSIYLCQSTFVNLPLSVVLLLFCSCRSTFVSQLFSVSNLGVVSHAALVNIFFSVCAYQSVLSVCFCQFALVSNLILSVSSCLSGLPS